MRSPYQDRPVDEWADITKELIDEHPLSEDVILQSATRSWSRLWSTWIGDKQIGFPIAEINPPATVIGYMFEKLIANDLAATLPGDWRGGLGSEKDLHCIKDDSKSVEMKSSGQLGDKIYGNRSYGQLLEDAGAAKKDKSGYYITVNFFGRTLTLLRFGWIDSTDWQAQKSPTGQMAELKPEVYQYKLRTIVGAYMLDGPIQLLPRVGTKAAKELNDCGLMTIGQFLTANDLPAKYKKTQELASKKYRDAMEKERQIDAMY